MVKVSELGQLKRPNVDVGGVLAALDDLGKAPMRRPVDAESFVDAAGAKGKAMGSAMKGTGSALTSVGSVLGALAQKRAEEKNRIAIIKAQSVMGSGAQEVQDHFDKNPDKPESFVQQAQHVGGKVLKGLGTIEGLDDVGREIVARDSDQWHRELVTGSQAASDKQIFANSADAQLSQIYDDLKIGNADGASARVPALRESGVVHDEVIDRVYRDIAEVGGQQEVARVYAEMRDDPRFTLEHGLRSVDGFKYLPLERRPTVKEDLAIAHAELVEERQLDEFIAKDPSGALAALADRYKFLRLKPETRGALLKSAEGERERMAALAYDRSLAYINRLDGEQLKGMTLKKLGEAMAAGKDAALWMQTMPFHKGLVQHYLALKQGTAQLNDPERMRALEAAIDDHVPDLDGPAEAAHLRMSIEHGFEGADQERLMKRMDGREKARVPANTAMARQMLYQWSYQDGAGGKVKSQVDREAQVISRLLDEKALQNGGFNSDVEAVQFVKDELGYRGWNLAKKDKSNDASGGQPTVDGELAIDRGEVQPLADAQGRNDLSKNSQGDP